MKSINIITIGKIHYEGIDSICEIFRKRIESFYNIKEFYIKEDEKNQTLSIIEKINIINKSKIKDKENLRVENLISCSEEGDTFNSVEFSKLIFNKVLVNHDNVIFIIGNRDGIPEFIKNISKYIISFSKMTFGHQIFKVLLYEQIYRGICLNKNIKYAF